MKFQHTKKIWASPFYIHFQKHYCPQCQRVLEKRKVSKIVNSHSEEAKKFDFSSGETYMIGDVKFIWTEFRCPICKTRFSIDEMKRIENSKEKK